MLTAEWSWYRVRAHRTLLVATRAVCKADAVQSLVDISADAFAGARRVAPSATNTRRIPIRRIPIRLTPTRHMAILRTSTTLVRKT